MTSRTRLRIIKIACELDLGASPKEIIARLGAEFGLSAGRMRNLIGLAYKYQEAGALRRNEIIEAGLKATAAYDAEIAARPKIATEQEAESYLTEIMRGERMEEKVISTPHGYEKIKVPPSARDVLKAYSLFRGNLPPKYYILKNGRYVLAAKKPTEEKETAEETEVQNETEKNGTAPADRTDREATE